MVRTLVHIVKASIESAKIANRSSIVIWLSNSFESMLCFDYYILEYMQLMLNSIVSKEKECAHFVCTYIDRYCILKISCRSTNTNIMHPQFMKRSPDECSVTSQFMISNCKLFPWIHSWIDNFGYCLINVLWPFAYFVAVFHNMKTLFLR